MVSKCANPECVATFRYFHVGKLFRMETSTGLERRHSMGQDDAALAAISHAQSKKRREG